MARILPHDDQDWSDVNRREEPPERVTLPAWGWLALAFVAAFYLRGPLATLLDDPALGTWTTIFVSISVQALPFLVLGVVLSGAISALVPPGWLARMLPKQPLVAVSAAGLAGVALPGCECGAVDSRGGGGRFGGGGRCGGGGCLGGGGRYGGGGGGRGRRRGRGDGDDGGAVEVGQGLGPGGVANLVAEGAAILVGLCEVDAAVAPRQAGRVGGVGEALEA